jgi:1-phosphofructokinase
MSRRVATITLNPAYDLVGSCPVIERGEVNLVQTTGLHAAGKGINVAKVLKDLGIDVTVGGFLGKENQDGFQLLFSDLGIANRFQVVQGRTRINVKLTEKQGDVTDFNFSGFNVTPQDWERFVNDSLTWLGQFDMVAVSGSLPTGVAPEAFTDWMIKLRSHCPCIIFDSSREALVAGLKAAPWLVKPNRRELEIWAGHKLRYVNRVSLMWSFPWARKARCGSTLPAPGWLNRRNVKWSVRLARATPWSAA